MIPTEEINRISIEETLGKPPAKADDPEMAAFREKVRAENKANAAKGENERTIFDCPPE